MSARTAPAGCPLSALCRARVSAPCLPAAAPDVDPPVRPASSQHGRDRPASAPHHLCLQATAAGHLCQPTATEHNSCCRPGPLAGRNCPHSSGEGQGQRKAEAREEELRLAEALQLEEAKGLLKRETAIAMLTGSKSNQEKMVWRGPTFLK